MQAKIITIGDEILVGQTVDTNSTFIAKAFNEIGVKVTEIVSITDTKDHIIEAVDAAVQNNEFVIVTGGLGPTNDDITKTVLTDYFNDELILYPSILKQIQAYFKRFKKPFLAVNELQAMLPKNATIIENDLGTASGMWFKKNHSNVLSLPGVPFEMKALFKKFLDKVKETYDLGNFYHKSVLVTGIGESYLAELLSDWEQKCRVNGLSVAYLPSVGTLKIRLTGNIEDKKFIDDQLNILVEKHSKYVVGYAGTSVGKAIGNLLLKNNETLGTIESCTGGGLAKKIVDVPGSSAYYLGSIVSYSYLLKESLVDVKHESIVNFGAVSEEVVIEMASNGKIKLGVDYCISISGVAGPDGGTEEKPVGTVWIAIATPNGVHTKLFNFGHNRSRNIQSTVMAALNFLRLILIKQI
ncbi:MAG: CinA family nicotinamide mononucleotide deamidase-related protein [Crocinitomicaceae bacterium]